MRHKLTLLVIALAPAIGLTLASSANSVDLESATAANAHQQYGKPFDKRASDLIGADVHNAHGEDLGEIKDLIVDVNSGRVHYAILSFGGFVGIGDKLFAYPMRSFHPATERDELVLNVDKSALDKAPGFDSQSWPDWNDNHAYRGQVDGYFGKEVTIQELPNQCLVRVSDLVDAEVVEADGKEIGEIKDLAIQMSDGTVRYAVVDFDSSWAPGDKLVVIPWKAMKTGDDADQVTLELDRKAVGRAPAFDRSAWPNLNDPNYRTRVDTYMVANPAIAPMEDSRIMR